MELGVDEEEAKRLYWSIMESEERGKIVEMIIMIFI